MALNNASLVVKDPLGERRKVIQAALNLD